MLRTGDEKIGLMYQEYGKLTGARCRNCEHLDVYTNGDNSRIWYKCHLYGVTNGPGTDWRAGNEACGGFTISPEDARARGLYGEVYRVHKGCRKKEPKEKTENQIALAI